MTALNEPPTPSSSIPTPDDAVEFVHSIGFAISADATGASRLRRASPNTFMLATSGDGICPVVPGVACVCKHEDECERRVHRGRSCGKHKDGDARDEPRVSPLLLVQFDAILFALTFAS